MSSGSRNVALVRKVCCPDQTISAMPPASIAQNTTANNVIAPDCGLDILPTIL